ncbi:MAG TPA: XTP/dITP diphosphatase [Candidatus Binatia bacterium]
MIQLLVATTNPGKFAEVESYLKQFPIEIRSLQNLENYPAVVEDGATFEANALRKARTLAQFCGMLTLADDSGLEVDALNGAPGIYSARYAGEEGDDAKNNEKLLSELRHVPEEKRTARFVCALALCDPSDGELKTWTVRASCEGRIAFRPSGANGFGYDPLFFYPPLGKTFGEIETKIKATVSHRGKALKELAELLPTVVELSAKP